MDPPYRWILPRNSRMLAWALLYESNPCTLTNGIRSSVESGLRRDTERRSYYQRRRQYCGKSVHAKTIGEIFSDTDIAAINTRTVQYHYIRESVVGPIPNSTFGTVMMIGLFLTSQAGRTTIC